MGLGSLHLHQFFSHRKTSAIYAAIYATIFALVLDTSINQIYYLNINQLVPPPIKVTLFIVIAAISLVGQYCFLQFVKNKSTDIVKANILHIKTISKVAYIVQSILTTLFLILLFQMIIQSQYSVVILMSCIGISSLFGVSILILLASRLLSWFRTDKNVTVLLYGISSAIIASNIAFGVVIVTDLLLTKPDMIQPHFGWEYATSSLGPLNDAILYGYSISSISGFIIAWISTIVLLRQFSVRWRDKAHWIIVSMPLAYFLIQFQPFFFNLFSQLIGSQPILYNIVITLFITYSKPIGGLIFGGAFWSITRRLRNSGIKMDYTTISALGFILLFISNQMLSLSSASYPPFGLAAITLLGLSCYMILVGIYSSAISISQNVKLRIAIRKLVENKSNLLDSIGATQMSRYLENEIFDAYNKVTDKIQDDIGIAPSLSPTEAKEYCDIVIGELERSRSSQKA